MSGYKQLFFVFLAAALLFSTATAQAGPILSRIIKGQELKVGMDPNFPPLEAVTKDGRVIGFDVDLARAIAKSMGVKLALKSMAFKDLIPALKRGDIDLAVSGMTMTPERNLKVLFVGPYILAGQTILIHHKQANRITGPDDLNHKDWVVAAPAHTTAAQAVQELMPKAKLLTGRNEMEAVKLLLKGKAHALVADRTFNALMGFRHRSAGILHLDTPFTFEPLGIALNHGDAELVNWLENFLLLMKGSGRMDRLGEKWFRDPGWIDQIDLK